MARKFDPFSQLAPGSSVDTVLDGRPVRVTRTRAGRVELSKRNPTNPTKKKKRNYAGGRAMTASEQTRWIISVLSNDEASTDAELVEYFISNGLPPFRAREWVAKRGRYLKNLFPNPRKRNAGKQSRRKTIKRMKKAGQFQGYGYAPGHETGNFRKLTSGGDAKKASKRKRNAGRGSIRKTKKVSKGRGGPLSKMSKAELRAFITGMKPAKKAAKRKR